MKTENLITKNKKAFFDYEVLETFEAWIVLKWYEVKSIRLWHINLKWSYISFVWWHCLAKQIHISPLNTLANKSSFVPTADRKILLHKKTIFYLTEKQKLAWLTIIPLEVYLKWSLIKIKVWLCKWKKDFDKKQILKEKTLDKEAKMFLKKSYF